MCMFAAADRANHVEKIRRFLGIPKAGFLEQYGLKQGAHPKHAGRLPAYPEDAMDRLYAEVNAKAARAEAPDTTLGERIRLARDCQDLSDSDLARRFEVSRELVRRWGLNLSVPQVPLAELAEYLGAPVAWMEKGGEENLLANSLLGQRIGKEAADAREKLYSLTLLVVGELDDDTPEDALIAHIEKAVFTWPELALNARRAGGRFQAVDGHLRFGPWQPVPEKRASTAKEWPAATEEIIAEELADKPTTYGAWQSIKTRCEVLGLPYPAKITLHKRVERDIERAERLGWDVNDRVVKAVTKVGVQIPTYQ